MQPPAETPFPNRQIAIAQAALLLIEELGFASEALLLEQFPGEDAAVAECLSKLSRYSGRVATERNRAQWPRNAGKLEAEAQIGPYTIEGVVGQGAMGTVYSARQQPLNQLVALKVLPPALVARDPRFLERFRREARLASQLTAPGVAQVFGYGEEGGLVYFAMQFVPGLTLREVLRELAFARRTGSTTHQSRDYVRLVVERMHDLANTVAAIHAAGLVHRDIKPSNIILSGSERAQTALTHAPVLVDFGLLRSVEDPGLTGSRTLLGTPAYASPEAKLGRPVNASSDVFSLGAVLHDTLAATTSDDRHAATAGLSNVRVLNPLVDERLAAIVRMAMEERPDLRYADAAEFAAELDHYLKHRAIRALPTSPFARLHLWARRDPGHAARKILAYASLTACIVVAVILTQLFFGANAIVRGTRDALQTGAFAQAVEQLHQVNAKQWLIGWLPGTQADRALAQDLAELEQADRDLPSTAEQEKKPPLPLAQVLSCLERGSRDDVHRAHDTLLQIVLTEGHEELHGVLFAFLTRELSDKAPAWRRQLAAESAAQISTCAPFIVDQGEALPAHARTLVAALLSVAADECLSETPSDTALYSLSALSGMLDDDAYQALLAFPLPGDTTYLQLQELALERTMLLRYAKGYRLPLALHLTRLFRNLELVALEPDADTSESSRSKAWKAAGWSSNPPMLKEPPAYLRCDALLNAVQQTTAAIYLVAPELNWATTDAIDALLDDQGGDVQTPVKEQARALLAFAYDYYSAATADPELASPRASALLQFLPPMQAKLYASRITKDPAFFQPNTWLEVWKHKAHTYTNVWDASKALGSQSLERPVDELGVALDSGTQTATLKLVDGSPQLEGLASKVEWNATAIYQRFRSRDQSTTWFFELRAPRRAWVELTVKVPPFANRATVTFNQRLAGRSHLPYTGAAESRLTMNDKKSITLSLRGAGLGTPIGNQPPPIYPRTLPPSSTDDSIPDTVEQIPPDVLVGTDTLVLRFEHADGPNLIWLNGMTVKFER